METLKSMLEKLTKLSRKCRYLEAKPDMMITYEDKQDTFQGVDFTYHRYYLY